MTEPYHFALIGEDIEYSRSPQIFEALFRQTGVVGRFDLHSVSSGQLGGCVVKLVSAGVRGFSVTIPHKQSIIQYLDEVDPVAKSLDAVNSVRIDQGSLAGCNTDCFGFSYSMTRAGLTSRNGTAFVFGSGGAARAIIYTLHHDFGIRRFLVSSRSPSNVQILEQTVTRHLPSVEILPLTTSAGKASTDSPAHIVVNCTPLGGANHPEASPFPEDFDWQEVRYYVDLNYNDDNQAMKQARAKGVEVVDGSAMLVAQAIRSFELWTGREATFEPIYREVFGAL